MVPSTSIPEIHHSDCSFQKAAFVLLPPNDVIAASTTAYLPYLTQATFVLSHAAPMRTPNPTPPEHPKAAVVQTWAMHSVQAPNWKSRSAAWRLWLRVVARKRIFATLQRVHANSLEVPSAQARRHYLHILLKKHLCVAVSRRSAALVPLPRAILAKSAIVVLEAKLLFPRTIAVLLFRLRDMLVQRSPAAMTRKQTWALTAVALRGWAYVLEAKLPCRRMTAA